ncbi:MAG: alpha/beta hydrolase, partial [Eggerthellaceae bacterium]|nr:alpha/beta hydrolase [Eggerthellaceae bacterium]
STRHIVISIHGGAFISQVSPYHVAFCDRLAAEANATVLSPVYPLAPNHTYQEAFLQLGHLYNAALASGKPVVLMGDSAGGGLAASFCMDLAQEHLPKPTCAVLFSPWVDVSMSGDYDELLKVDPMLGVDGLRCIGEAWAGETPTTDWRVSPLFGDMASMPPTTLFVGTHEIFYADVTAFRDKLEKAGINVRLIIGQEMNHIWPFFPIPEAETAFKQVLEVLETY